MKKNITIIICLSVIMATMTIFAGYGFASPIEGTIQGYNCVAYKKICAVDSQDPSIAAENLFVVLDENNKYYFISNLNRAVLARYYSKKVRLAGKTHEKYNTVQASQLQVYVNDRWKTVWDQDKQKAEQRMLTIK